MSLYDRISGSFRRRRRQVLLDGLGRLHQSLGRNVRVLDVGGVEVFWEIVDPPEYADITIINLPEALEKPYWFTGRCPQVRCEPGSALDLSAWRERNVDVVTSNSVIEHVGGWSEVARAARELRSVAPHGWVQTPAYTFPIEPHYALPFIHWFGAPVQAKLLRLLPHHGARRGIDLGEARLRVEENNLLTAAEFKFLFADAEMMRERFVGLTKSLIATWGLMSRPS
jgi:hypothetical protein